MVTTAADAPDMEVSSTAPIPLSRLVWAELRTMAGFWAARWLFLIIGAFAALFIVVSVATAAPVDQNFLRFVVAAAVPLNLLLPVLGIVLISIGWTHRTASTTYTLMPVRRRALLAQIQAVSIIGSAAIALGLGLAALAAIPSGSRVWSVPGADSVAAVGLVHVVALFQGAALGLLFLNPSSAILGYLAIPVGIDLLSSMWPPLFGARPWFDLWTAQLPFLDAAPLVREQWFHLATSTGLWVVLPFVVGVIRLHRVDIL